MLTQERKGVIFYASIPGQEEKKIAAWQPDGSGGGKLYRARHPNTAPYGYHFPQGTLYSTVHNTVVSWATEVLDTADKKSPIKITEQSRYFIAKEGEIHGKSIH